MSVTIVPYLGGKRLLAKQIVPRIPKHTTYAEVFCGAAHVYFNRPEPSKVEVINDINKELTTLYRVVKHHLDEFVRYFRWTLVARDEFKRLLKENPDTLTDIQRAARHYYLLKNAFGARCDSPAFGIAASSPPRFNLTRIEEDLSEIHMRLHRTYIENLHYSDLIKRYDKPETFFYLDPPYYNCEEDYGKNIFFREDFLKLRDQLKGIQGKFMMSINDVPEMREWFKDFNIHEVQTNYSISKTVSKNKVTELLIMNYEPETN